MNPAPQPGAGGEELREAMALKIGSFQVNPDDRGPDNEVLIEFFPSASSEAAETMLYALVDTLIAGPLAALIAERDALKAEVAALRTPEPTSSSGGDGGAAAMRDDVVSARLTAWQEGHGGVDLTFASERRVALALDAPHGTPKPDLERAREARLGSAAHLGKLPNRLFAVMMDSQPHEVTDLVQLVRPDHTRKQVYNAIGYLNRHNYIERIRHGIYRALPQDQAPQQGGGRP